MVLTIGNELDYENYTISASGLQKVKDAYQNAIPVFLKQNDTLYAVVLLQKDGDNYNLAAVNSSGSYDNIGINSGTLGITVNGKNGTNTIRIICKNCKFEDGETQKQVEVETGTLYTLPTVIPDDGYLFRNWNINGQNSSDQQNYSFTVLEDYECTAICYYRGQGGGGSS